MSLAIKIRLVLFLIASLVSLSAVNAGTLSVSPVKVSMPASGKAEVIHLKNPDATPTLVQIEAIAWTEDSTKEAIRTDDVIAVPPVFELDGGREQVIRLALRRPVDQPTERAYRLLITEVPMTVNASGLNFAVRLDLPLFVTPDGAKPNPVWLIEPARDGKADLVLTNQGAAHIQVQTLELRSPNSPRILFTTDEPVYALAGETRRWPLGQTLAALPASLEVHTETHLGPKTAPVIRP
jgi:fimbrial chaperone protein